MSSQRLEVSRRDFLYLEDKNFSDVLLIESVDPAAPHKASGTLLSINEQVNVLFVKNHSGFVHLRRSDGEVLHVRTCTPMSEPEVHGWVLMHQRELTREVRAAQAILEKFKRNYKSFQGRMSQLNS